MILNFIISNLNTIVLVVWIIFLIIVAIRFFRPTWVKNISFQKLIFIALGLNIFYGLFVTWGQYYVWTINDPTGTFTQLPYFFQYAWTHYWLNILISFFLSGILYSIFKIWKSYRGGFMEQGPELLLVLMLIPGWSGIIVMMSLGFIFAIILYFYSYFRKNTKFVNVEPAFIIASFFALLFTNYILDYLLKI